MPRPKPFTKPDIAELRDGLISGSLGPICAKDEQGLSARCQCQAPLELVEWANQIIDTGKLPFHRFGDFLRWSLYLGCVAASGIDDTLPDFQRTIDRANALVRLRMRSATVTDHMEQLATELEKLRRDNTPVAWQEIARILDNEHKLATQEIETEPLWGTRWRDELLARFAHLRTIADVNKPTTEYIDLRPSKAYHEED